MGKKIVAVLALIAATISLASCNRTVSYYDADITRIDLTKAPQSLPAEYGYLYEIYTVDNSREYLAHPDSILLNNGSILSLYPAGHGKGEVLNAVSIDGGRTWQTGTIATPVSWKESEETPTIYRLQFAGGGEKLIMISANPKWPGYARGDGFNVSLSDDDGATWSQFSKYFGKGSAKPLNPIVAMSSLTRLKEDGVFVDKWMGLFHDNKFINYKTILIFDADGQMHWSVPEPYFQKYRTTERRTQMCEVEVIRSNGGQGDRLCLITRSNSKRHNSLVSFSDDEGKTWSLPKEVSSALSGERHKAEYVGDRLVITFRSIERAPEMAKKYAQKRWYSEGWVAWVGKYEDIERDASGQYRIRLAHTYLPHQTESEPTANADTGYAGIVKLADDTIVLTSYGCFGDKNPDGTYKTYIVSKRIRLDDLDKLFG